LLVDDLLRDDRSLGKVHPVYRITGLKENPARLKLNLVEAPFQATAVARPKGRE
jgi:hypothetical protein